jgi:hypothetical protein
LALRQFLGLGMSERVPDHSSLTVIRQRLPLELHEEVFAFVLRILIERGLYRGKTLAVDATMLEANAAMKSIVRRGELVADRGYHKAQTLAECAAYDLRTYIPERADRAGRRWTDKPAAWRDAFHRNRSRVRREKSRRLQRLRSERMERSFAHVCNTGGARRTKLRGVENVQKRYLITLAGRNLTVLMRALFGIGAPRSLQGLSTAIFAAIGTLVKSLWELLPTPDRLLASFLDHCRQSRLNLWRTAIPNEKRHSSTGC